jgi:hypothetical protein
MGQKMAYLEVQVLSHCLGLSTFTAPTNLFFIASTAAFDPTLTGSSVVEPTDSAYARVSAANDSSFWDTPAGSNPTSTSNLSQVSFPAAVIDWGTILSVYAGDASTAGNLLYGTAVPGAGIPITALSTFQIPIGAFVVRET